MKLTKYICLSLFAILMITSCTIDEMNDPNGPSISGYDNASKSQLQTLVSGLENHAREEVGYYYDVLSIIGRDYYFFTGSDPRYTGELLGKGESVLDNAGFYGTRPYSGRYKTVKMANLLVSSAGSSQYVSDAERKGYDGFANTMKAYELLLLANMQYSNGIRIDVSDPDNLGGFVDYEAALAQISTMLDEANSQLQGASFAFTLSSGFSGFDTPVTFAKFNRAIAARVALYQGQKSKALTLLNGSFLNQDGSLNEGPSRYFSTAGGDLSNPVFRAPNTTEAIIAHPQFVAQASANDNRLSYLQKRSATASLDGLSGDYDVMVFNSLSSNIPFVNNVELMLIKAESLIGTNNAESIAILNVIRNKAGIGDYSGGNDNTSVLDEVVRQRRYSLFGQGHRWVDMRRLGRLDQLPIDRAGDNVWEKLPRPVTETE